MSDERQRLAKTYRELDGKELLSLYATRDDLSPIATECLQNELKLRGIDPDSLKPTVPSARLDDADDEPSQEGGLANRDAEDLPAVVPEVPDELHGEFDPTGSMIICGKCSTPNHPDEDRCRSCQAPLPRSVAENAPRAGAHDDEPTGRAPRVGAESLGDAEPGTLASATFGLVGLSATVFAAYLWLRDPGAGNFAMAAFLVGAASMLIASGLYRKSR